VEKPHHGEKFGRFLEFNPTRFFWLCVHLGWIGEGLTNRLFWKCLQRFTQFLNHRSRLKQLLYPQQCCLALHVFFNYMSRL
jgi:hypothetical protein